MNLSDIDLINISQFLISIMMVVVFILAWRIVEQKKYVLYWAIFYAFAALNGILNATSDVFPDRNVYWVVVNACSLVTQLLALGGFRSRAGKAPFPIFLVGYFVVVELLVIYFTMINPHMGLRMVFIPYSGALTVVLIAVQIIQVNRPLRTAEKSAAFVFVLYSLVQLSAGTLALLQGAARNEHYLSLYSQVNFLFMPAFFTGLGLFTLLILVDDLASKLKQQVITDYLTGLLNRRGFKQKADALIQQQSRTGVSLAVIVADIDRFKSINDQYGHQVGDEVLQHVSKWMHRLLLPPAVMGRTGGEEFAAVVPAANIDAAWQLAEHLRQQLSQQSRNTNPDLHITGSFGVAMVQDSLEQALIQADQAMYQAKAEGRNRVVVGDH